MEWEERIRKGRADLESWVERARRHVEWEDLLHLEPIHIYFTVLDFIDPDTRVREWCPTVDARDPDFVDLVLDAVRIVARTWFSLKVEGVENVPREGPALLVANHNGGILPLDSLFTLLAIRDAQGVERPVNLLGHDLLGADKVARRLFPKLGIVRADMDSAARALQAGHLVLVYPGSEMESWRPWTQRDRVVLGQRQGFMRLALQEGVPIVPLVSVGTHEQLLVLRRGARLARLLGLHSRLRAEAFPIVFALPWGITTGFMPYLPLPAQTTLRFGPPLAWPHLGKESADDEATVSACREEVRVALQSMLDDLHRGRVPLLGDRLRRFLH